MALQVYLVQWDVRTAATRILQLEHQGWLVSSESRDGQAAYQQIRTRRPDLVVFDLATQPAYSLQVAEALRKCRSLTGLPFLFVDGDARALHSARQRITNAQFTNSNQLISTIALLSDKLLSCLV